MKKRVLLFVLITVLAVCSMFSCKNKNNGPSNDDGGVADSFIYGENTQLTIVMTPSEDKEIKKTMQSFCNTLALKLPSYPDIIAPTDAKRGNELVIGKSDRAVSVEAYRLLERIRLDEEQEGSPRLLIYTDGSSIAIAYDECEEDVTFYLGIEYFLENLLVDNLKCEAGTLYKEIVDLDAYFQAKDDALVEEKWAALANAIGGDLGLEVVSSFKKLYNLYTDDMVDWFANLYDPAIGGWYYSNSGRNTDGYLPDAESTQQALRFIDDSGMISTIAPNGYEDALPEDIKAAIGEFIYNLQDPNGYFYHPQWTKDAVDNKTSRRSRDLGWCTSILSQLGITPKYTTPSGVAGADDIEPASVYLTGRLGGSVVSAASAVILADDSGVAVDPKLKDKESFIKYLDSLNVQTNSYSAGNTLTSFYSEIAARDKALGEQNVGYSLVEILINYLNEKQFDNGTWHAEINYYAINGFMKMSGVYSKSGSPLPNSQKALEACIAAITSDEEPGAITDIYNTWFATLRAFNIISKTEGDAGKAYVEEQRQMLLRNAPEAIALTAKRVAKYQKVDGSFSYSPNGAPKNSQGMPVSIGVNEGDINGTLLCSTDLLTYIYGSLGLAKYRVPTHTYNDWRHYLEILTNLQPVIKDEEDSIYEPLTFDDEALGEVDLDEITYNARSAALGGGITIIEDPRNPLKKVLNVSSVATKSDSVEIVSQNLSNAFSCFAFEGDFCLLSSNTDFPIRITMGESYIVSIKIKNGKVIFVESSSETSSKSKDVVLPMTAELGEWFRLKIEYYKGDHDNVRIKIYFDSDLSDGASEKLVAVSDNYLDQNGDKFVNGKGEPTTQYKTTMFWFMKAYDIEFMMDNVCSYKLDKKYTKYTDKENPLKLNVDAPVEEGGDTDSTPDYTDTYYNDTTVPGTRYDYSEKLGKDYIYNKSYDAESETETVSVPIPVDIRGGKLNVANLSNWAGFAIANKDRTQGTAGAKYVFDTTFVWKGGSQKAGAGAAAYVGLLGEHKAVDNTYMISSFTVSFSETDPDVLIFGGAELQKNKAYNIRIEYTVGGKLELYVDNVSVNVSATKGGVSDEMSFLGFGIYMRKNFTEAFEYSFDDTFLGIIYPEGTGDGPIVPVDPYAPPADEGLPEDLETMYGNPAYDGTRYDFETALDFEKIYDKTYDASTDKSNISSPEIGNVADGKLVVDNGGKNWKGIALKNLGNTEGGDGATYVFEADFRWTSGHQLTSQLASGAAFLGFLGDHKAVDNTYMSGFGYITFIEGEQDVMRLYGVELKRGTTYNIRIEYTVGSYATIYVNGEVANKTALNVGAKSDKSSFEGFGLYVRKNLSPDLEFTLDNVYMDVIPKKAEEKVTVLDTPTGAEGTVVLMHDDGDLSSVSLIDAIFREYGLRGNVALLGNKVYSGGVYNTAAIKNWQSYLDTGRWQITSHSMTHTFWGLTDKAESVYAPDGTLLATITEDGMITYEVATSAEVLRTAFPGQRVLTFAYPGFWAERSLGLDRFSAVARLLVENTYVAGRDAYGDKTISLDDESADWKFSPSYQLDAGNVQEIIDVVKSAQYGEMAVIFTHKVIANDSTDAVGSSKIYEKDFRAVATAVAELQSAGKVWCAFYEDAVLYTREKQAAEVEYTISNEEIRINLTTSGLDNSIYNYPLTLRALIPEGWEAVKVTQGDSVSYARINGSGSERYADVSVIPGGGTATLTPADLEDASFYTYFGDENVTGGDHYDFEDGILPETVITNTVDGDNSYTSTDAVIADENGNHVLSENSTKWKGFAFLTGDDTAYTSGKYVFETDFVMKKAAYKSTGALFVGFITYENQLKNGEVICENTTSNAAAFADCYMVVSQDETTFTWFGQTLRVGVKYNLRAVYDVETDVCTIYVDGVLVAEQEYATNKDCQNRDDSVFRGFMFYPRVSGCEFTLDNVFIGVVAEDTSRPEETPEDPETPIIPDDPNTPELPNVSDDEDAPGLGDVDTDEWYGH